MNTAEQIYQETKDLPETEAREVLNFVKRLKAKLRRELTSQAKSQYKEIDLQADVSEFDQFGSVYDGNFDRDACYDRPNLR
jgi:hypothetical protein